MRTILLLTFAVTAVFGDGYKYNVPAVQFGENSQYQQQVTSFQKPAVPAFSSNQKNGFSGSGYQSTVYEATAPVNTEYAYKKEVSVTSGQQGQQAFYNPQSEVKYNSIVTGAQSLPKKTVSQSFVQKEVQYQGGLTGGNGYTQQNYQGGNGYTQQSQLQGNRYNQQNQQQGNGYTQQVQSTNSQQNIVTGNDRYNYNSNPGSLTGSFQSTQSTFGNRGGAHNLGGASHQNSAFYQQSVYSQQEPIVKKHYYVHVAPEEEVHQTRQQLVVPAPEKHYKIIFVKAPSYESRVQQLAAIQPQVQEKTIVYVLVKTPEELENLQIPSPVPTEPSKPEVYFIKYKSNKKHNNLDVLSGVTQIGGSGHLDEETINAELAAAGGLQNIAGVTYVNEDELTGSNGYMNIGSYISGRFQSDSDSVEKTSQGGVLSSGLALNAGTNRDSGASGSTVYHSESHQVGGGSQADHQVQGGQQTEGVKYSQTGSHQAQGGYRAAVIKTQIVQKVGGQVQADHQAQGGHHSESGHQTQEGHHSVVGDSDNEHSSGSSVSILTSGSQLVGQTGTGLHVAPRGNVETHNVGFQTYGLPKQ